MTQTNDAEMERLKQQFTDFLKRRKYRNTQERFRVLERIGQLDRHFSADDLYLYMNQQGDRVSRATIYSTLDLLTKCTILMKHRFQGESAHFELSSRMPDHDHLLCSECGRIVEFRASQIDLICEEVAKSYGFNSLKHSLQIFATCPNAQTCEYNH